MKAAASTFANRRSVGLVVGLTVIGAVAVWLRPGLEERWETWRREREILAAAAVAQPGQVLLIGDSLALGSPLNELCGRAVLNAGVGGSTVGDWPVLAERLAEQSRPEVIVVILGANDIRRRTDPELWEQRYRQLLGRLSHHRVVVAPVLPQRAAPGQAQAEVEASVAALNASLARLARPPGAMLIAATEWPENAFRDGVHLNARGYALLNASLARTCHRLSGS